jgi:hypothetical protein
VRGTTDARVLTGKQGKIQTTNQLPHISCAGFFFFFSPEKSTIEGDAFKKAYFFIPQQGHSPQFWGLGGVKSQRGHNVEFNAIIPQFFK